MRRLDDCLNELTQVSPDIAWKLVDAAYGKVGLLVFGASGYVLLGFIGFIGTGSLYYFGGSIIAAALCLWRVWQCRVYTASRNTASPSTWAKRSIPGAWLTAATWGAWSISIVCEPNKSLVALVLAVQAATVIGSPVRTSSVPIIAYGQILFASSSFFIACLLSGDLYFVFCSLFVGGNALSAISLTKSLHQQTVRRLLHDEEKSDFITRLEDAKQELEVINHHLAGLVDTDALTEVANRRAFDLALAREWLRSLRDKTPLSLLLLDVDQFKAFNDFYGHQAGDKCLQRVAATIGGVIKRPSDLLARYGGEEFVVLLPQTGPQGAAEIAAAILAAFTDIPMPHDNSIHGHVTVSIGVATTHAVPGAIVDKLVAHADAALYVAKRSGRNCLHVAKPPAGDNVVPEAPSVGRNLTASQAYSLV